MQGKILGDGVILGRDEKRYKFGPDDVSGKAKVGSDVDFVIDGEFAREIYIIKQSFNLELGDNEAGVRNLGLIGAALPILGSISYIGIAFIIASFICILFVILKISKLSGEINIKINYIKSLIAMAISFPIMIIGFVMVTNTTLSNALVIVGFLIALFGFELAIFGLWKYFRAYQNLREIYSDSLFIYAAAFKIAGIATIWGLVGYLLILIGAFLELAAWNKSSVKFAH